MQVAPLRWDPAQRHLLLQPRLWQTLGGKGSQLLPERKPEMGAGGPHPSAQGLGPQQGAAAVASRGDTNGTDASCVDGQRDGLWLCLLLAGQSFSSRTREPGTPFLPDSLAEAPAWRVFQSQGY